MNIAGIVGLFLTLVGAALYTAECFVRSFVEVFMDDENGTTFPRIAGVGVFVTEYDANVLSEQALAESRLPLESYVKKTDDFDLLFPGPSNLIQKALPNIIDDETVATLQLLASTSPAAAAGVTQLAVNRQAVLDRNWQSCEETWPENIENMTLMMSGLIDTFVPTLVRRLVPDIIDAINETSAGIGQLLQAPIVLIVGALDPVGGLGLAVATADGAADIPACAGVDLATVASTSFAFAGRVLTSTQFECLGEIYKLAGQNEVMANSPTLSALTNSLGNNIGICAELAADSGLSVTACINALVNPISLVSEPFAPIADVGTSATNLCALVQGAGLCDGTREGYAVLSLSIVNEVFDLGASIQAFLSNFAAARPAFRSYFAAVAALTQYAEPTDTFQTLLVSIQEFLAGPFYPPSFEAPWVVADLTIFLSVVLGAVEPRAYTSNLLSGFETINGFTGGQLAAVQLLFTRCEDESGLDAPSDCVEWWPYLFADGVHNGAMDLTKPLSSLPAELQLACNNDQEDRKKIRAAQTQVFISGVVVIAAFAVGVAGTFHPESKGHLLVAAGVLTFISVIMNISALLTIQSAPIYDGVGGDIVPYAPYFDTGVVLPLAFGSLGALLCATISFCVGGCKAMKASDVPEEKEEAKASV